ncbi:MAG: hypothetical protein J6Q68_04860 [Clostridia bacterium]|nr:hypothetical protein [Clostridia bacterium]
MTKKKQIIKKCSIILFYIVASLYSFCAHFLLLFLAFNIIFSSIPSDYVKECNWNCDEATFETEYCEAYNKKLDELILKYDLSLEREMLVDPEHYVADVMFYLHAEEYEIRFCMLHLSDFGVLYAYFDYYLEDKEDLQNLDLTPQINFMNDFVHFVGYDTKIGKNHFESLYLEMLETDSSASYIYHKDDDYLEGLVSTIGYFVCTYEFETTTYCEFRFKGLLKPLELD